MEADDAGYADAGALEVGNGARNEVEANADGLNGTMLGAVQVSEERS